MSFFSHSYRRLCYSNNILLKEMERLNDHKVHAVEKAIMLLDCFWRERRPLSLTELAGMTGWPKSTVHSLLSSMLETLVVEQSAMDGKYRLGLHLFEYGCAISEHWDVVKLAKPHLRTLVSLTGESCYLANMIGDNLMLVDSAEPNNAFRVVSTVGTRLPLHCSSQGKAILANMDIEEVRRILRRTGMKSYTAQTLQSADVFLSQLAAVRESGIASEYEEYRNGMCSFASPIFDYNGNCSSAIGVVCILNSSLRSEAVPAGLLAALKKTAEAISTELGWRF